MTLSCWTLFQYQIFIKSKIFTLKFYSDTAASYQEKRLFDQSFFLWGGGVQARSYGKIKMRIQKEKNV